MGNSLGFALGLASMATVRELLGTGSWFGIPLFWEGQSEIYRWALMVLPPGAFLTLGLLLGAANWIGEGLRKRPEKKLQPEG